MAAIPFVPKAAERPDSSKFRMAPYWRIFRARESPRRHNAWGLKNGVQAAEFVRKRNGEHHGAPARYQILTKRDAIGRKTDLTPGVLGALGQGGTQLVGRYRLVEHL